MTRSPINTPTRGDWFNVALFLVLWLLVLPLMAAASEPGPAILPAIGEATTYTEETGTRWCATVRSIATGAGAVPWAWVTIDADPRRVFHVRYAELRPGCGEGAL